MLFWNYACIQIFRIYAWSMILFRNCDALPSEVVVVVLVAVAGTVEVDEFSMFISGAQQ